MEIDDEGRMDGKQRLHVRCQSVWIRQRATSCIPGVAEEFFDQESQNSWDGQFTESGRSSTDDGKARSQYFREVEILKKETRLKGSEGCEWGNPFKIGR